MNLLLILALVVASPFRGISQSADRSTEELDIREATFRYQFGDNHSAQEQRARSYYLSIMVNGKESDPDERFMARFVGNKPPVKKLSECERSNSGGAIDKTTGEKGLIFRTEAIKWVSDSEVEVEGGYWEGGEGASANTYYLRKIQGKWQVQRNKLHWVA